jgi:DNA processing protein
VLTPGLSRAAARRALASFGSADAVLRAPRSVLASVLDAPRAALLASEPAAFAAQWQATRAWLAAPGRHAITLADAAYPPQLLQTADPPLVLFCEGDPALLAHPRMLAIVGSRSATPQGLDNARAFAGHLAARGFLVASGLAIGIDGAAHEGALEAGQPTLAVVAGGPDAIYPPRHRPLAARIAARGAVISEQVPGTPAMKDFFPQRNRILAGLSVGTLVVEATLRSGSLITARLAAEAGREVFALPGSIHAPQSKGCHALIKQGAKLVEAAADIEDELSAAPAHDTTTVSAARPSGAARRAARPFTPAEPAPGAADAGPDTLLDALGHDPVTLDALCARTGEPVERLLARLLELELEGRVARLAGGLFQRRSRG